VPLLLDSTDGVGVAVHDLGGPGGTGADDATPVLLLVHATGFNAGAWRPFAGELAVAHRVVALDLRGHGTARTPEGLDFAWEGFVDDVTAVLAAGILPPGPLHGIGHSMGGAALLTTAARHPGAFRSLWLFEPIAPPPGVLDGGPDRPNPMSEAAARRRPVFESLDAAFDNYASKPPLDDLHPDALRGYVEDGFEPVPDAEGGGVRLRCRPEWEAATFRMTGGSPAWDALPDLDVPVTVAMGAEAPAGPAAFAPAVADRLPHGRLDRYPELGHFGPLQDPAGLAKRVAEWVASV
jgi:pimeloyl-ACP methyl ester carboxylesterase